MNFQKLKHIFRKPPELKNLSIGKAGEKWAAFLYEKNGYELIAQNYEIHIHKKVGELDLICKKGNELVFVEVKTRRDESFMPLEKTITPAKIAYLQKMVKLYIQYHSYERLNPRIDFVGVLMNPVDNSVISAKIIENIIEDYE